MRWAETPSIFTYFRTTFDVDLLCARPIQNVGWPIFSGTATRPFTAPPIHSPAFCRDPAGALTVDLMLADPGTFTTIQGASRRCDMEMVLASPSPARFISSR